MSTTSYSTFLIYPIIYSEHRQEGISSDESTGLDWSSKINLSDGENAGVNSVNITSKIQKRYTSFKYLKEGRNPLTGTGGTKHDYREIRPKDRDREEMDIQVQGWFGGEDAKENMAKLDHYARTKDLVVMIATDQFELYHGTYGVANTPNYTYTDCDSDSAWYAGPYPSGPITTGNVDLDNTDFIQGSGSVYYEQLSPSGGAAYVIRYNPASYFSMPHQWLHFWLRASDSAGQDSSRRSID